MQIEEIAALKKEALRAAEDLVQSKPNSIGGYRKATYRPEVRNLKLLSFFSNYFV